MKLKIVVALFAIAVVFGMTGCKPKEITLTGQAFIVTQGAENVKLGDVEILLIDKSQTANFLQNKLPAIKSETSSLRVEYESANVEAQKASKVLASFETKMKNELDLEDTSQSLDRFLDTIGKSQPPPPPPPSQLQIKLSKTEADLEQNLTNAQLRLANASARLNDYPAGESYFADFSPPIIQKKLTDADGRFSFSYPRNSAFTIFAKAERMVGIKSEKYYWLVDAPNNVESAQLFLSNNNLVFIDPDGYFKIKPVDMWRDSTITHAAINN